MKKNEYKSIHFVDFTSKKDLRKYYLAADLFVLPTRYDIWGLVINEAMAYRLPIITTNKCGAGLTLGNESNGYIIEPNDVESLKKTIKNALDSDLHTKGIESYKKIQNYTIENMASRHLEIFHQ